jgi:hypothetical protein
MVGMPVNQTLSAKPVVINGNVPNGSITYVGDPVTLHCGNVDITVPLSGVAGTQ